MRVKKSTTSALREIKRRPARSATAYNLGSWVLYEDDEGRLVAGHRKTGQKLVIAVPEEGVQNS